MLLVVSCQGTTSQAAGKSEPEGGGGFNPRINPVTPAWALAPEIRFMPIALDFPSCHAASRVVPQMLIALYQGTTFVVPQIRQNSRGL